VHAPGAQATLADLARMLLDSLAISMLFLVSGASIGFPDCLKVSHAIEP